MLRTIGLFTSHQHHIDIPLRNVSGWEKNITTDYRHLLFILTRRSWTFFFFFNLNLYMLLPFFFSFLNVSIIFTSSVALQYLTRHKKLNPITCQLPWFLPASALKRSHLHQISSDQVISSPLPPPPIQTSCLFLPRLQCPFNILSATATAGTQRDRSNPDGHLARRGASKSFLT